MSPLLSYMLRAGLGLSAFYLLYALVLRRETHFRLNRTVLLAGLLLSFLIPAFPVASPFRVAAGAAPSVSWLPAGPPAFSIGLPDILAAVYAAGVLLFLARFGGHLVRLGLIVRRRGIRRFHGLRIVTVEREFSPFSFLGLVFVNEGLIEEGRLRRVLAHERVHIRQGHSLDLLLMEIVLSLQWCNPFVWPYKKAVQETHEYLADAGVIAQGFSPVRYQRLMFEQHVGARLFEFGNGFKQSQIKRRITMLARIPSPPSTRLKALLALPLALVLVLAFAHPRAAASTGPQDKTTVAASKEKLVKIQEEVVKLSQMADEIKMKLSSGVEEAAGRDLMKKLETIVQKRQELISVLEANGMKLPPPAPGEMLKKLEMKEADARAALEKTSDPAKKAELEEVLKKIAQMRQQIQAGVKGQPALGEKGSLEALQKSLAELKAKDADVRAKLEKTQDAQEKAKLEELLTKIAQKTDQVKSLIDEAKAHTVKTEAAKDIR